MVYGLLFLFTCGVFFIEDIEARKVEFRRLGVVYAVHFIQHPAALKLQLIDQRFVGCAV